jgi:shikimate kinase
VGNNLILIGMPGAGKSTLGVLLARQLGYGFLDTDLLISERRGKKRLQEVVDELGQDAFRAFEEEVCATLEAERTVISTGGSVVYFPRAMARFAELGPILWLDVPYPLIEQRVAAFPDRGLAIRPGQTLRDLYEERSALYERYGQRRVECGEQRPDQIVHQIAEILRAEPGLSD